MIELLIGMSLGMGIGFVSAWYYFVSCRLIRTKKEWYSDPVIAELYPEEAERVLKND